MSPKEPSDGRLSRPVVFAIAGVIVIAVAIGMSFWSNQRDEAPPAPAPNQQIQSNAAPSESSKPAAPAKPETSPSAEPTLSQGLSGAASAPPQAAAAAPSFDVVRIARDGRAVMAGRAAPGATVAIMDGDKEIGRVKADDHGEWVFTPDNPLEPGSQELSLRATNPSGESKTGDAPVVLVVPERKAASAGQNEALAIKVQPGGTVQLLQVPTARESSGGVSIDVVNFNEKGRLSVAGRAPNGAMIQLYLDNQSVGDATANAKGEWALTTQHPLSEGNHVVRADQVGADGKVVARAEITFASGAGGQASGAVTVAWGNSLWRIARRAYGTGFDYVIIYQANKDQIRNPDLIYPGQVFKLPAKS